MYKEEEMIMKSIRRMNYDEIVGFMNKNKLREITNNYGFRIYRNSTGGFDISSGNKEGMDLKLYLSLLEGLAQS